MSALPKPVLRGHIRRSGIKMIIGAFAFAIVNGSLYHFLVGVPRKQAYEESIRTYDPEAHYKDLVKWGYLKTSVVAACILMTHSSAIFMYFPIRRKPYLPFRKANIKHGILT